MVTISQNPRRKSGTSVYCVGSSFEEACSREYDKNSKKMTKDPAWRLLSNNKIYKIV